MKKPSDEKQALSDAVDAFEHFGRRLSEMDAAKDARDQIVAATSDLLGEDLDNVKAAFIVVVRKDGVHRLRVAGEIRSLAPGEVAKCLEAMRLLSIFPAVIDPPAPLNLERK